MDAKVEKIFYPPNSKLISHRQLDDAGRTPDALQPV